MRTLLTLFLSVMLVGTACAKVYDFNQSAYEEISQGEKIVNVPGGQIIHSRLNSNISSQNNFGNEVIVTQLVKDWVYFGKVIAPEGSLISGKITSIQRASYANRNAKVNISFYQIVRPDNVVINIQSKPICVTIGESRAVRGTRMVLEGIKQSVLSSTSISNVADNAVSGAIAGGYTFLTTKGEEVIIPFGTEFRINIINNINIMSYDN